MATKKSKTYKPDTMEQILCLLNSISVIDELACRVALRYGLPTNDVLELRRYQVEQGFAIINDKETGKKRKIVFKDPLRERLLIHSGKEFVFEHQTSPDKHRSAYSVKQNLIKTDRKLKSDVIRFCKKPQIDVVQKYSACGNIMPRIEKMFKNKNEIVTCLYMIADEMEKRKGVYIYFNED